MRYKFQTEDSPSARGRRAQEGDVAYPVDFPTDEGGRLTVVMGREGFVKLAACVLCMMRDDAKLRADAEVLATKMSVRRRDRKRGDGDK